MHENTAVQDSATNQTHERHTADAENAYPFFHPAPPLASSRYNRQLLIPSISLDGQQRISRSRVLVIGLGGLGSPACLYLAGAGVGTLGLLDHDVVERSNLHRQIVHRESSLLPPEGGGPMTKVRSALRGCRDLNSQVEYVAHEVRIAGANALDLIRDYDLVLDCTDNPATRYLVSDCCVVLGKTLVSGAAQRLEGQVVVLNWPVHGSTAVAADRGPCYRCVFPHPPSPDMVKSCSEIGILGPVVGAVGTLMASEALRLIVKGDAEERKSTMLLYNAWPSDPRNLFRVIGLRGRRKDCVACGHEDVLREKGLSRITAESIKDGRMDYESWCGVPEDVKLLGDDERVSPEEFMRVVGGQAEGKFTVVDVREEFEVELGPKIEGSINVPFSKILQNANAVAVEGQHKDNLQMLVDSVGSRPVYFVCQQGNDSQIAAKKLLDRIGARRNGEGSFDDRGWVGDVRGGIAALEKLTRPDS